MKKTGALFLSISLLFILSTTVSAAQNITGIWEGNYNSLTHLDWQQPSKEFTDQPNILDEHFQSIHGTLLYSLENSQESNRSGKQYKLKTKIVYDNDTIIFKDMTGNRINFLHFIGFPGLFSGSVNANSIPSLTSLDFPLTGRSDYVSINTSNSGVFQKGKARIQWDLALHGTLTLPVPYDTLGVKLVFNLGMKLLNSKKNRSQAVKFVITLPLKRNINPAIWKPLEIEKLLIGLSQHPFYDVTFNGPEQMVPKRLVERIWGGSLDGYTHMLNYAIDKFQIKRPVPTLMNLDLPVSGRYDRTSVATEIQIGKNAFSRSLIFIPSVYVHEYTHFKQSVLSMPSQMEREQEAHCIQQHWIKKNFSRFSSLNSRTLTNLLVDEVEGAFNTAYPKETFSCTGQLDRWSIIQSEIGTSSVTSQSQALPFQEQWDGLLQGQWEENRETDPPPPSDSKVEEQWEQIFNK